MIEAPRPRAIVRIVGLVVVGLAVGSCEMTRGAETIDGGGSLGALAISLLAAWGAPLLAYLILRPLGVRLVLRNMMKRAPSGGGSPAEPTATLPPAVPQDLDVLILDRTLDLDLDGAAAARRDRALGTGRATAWIFVASVGLFATAALAIWWITVRPGLAPVTTEPGAMDGLEGFGDPGAFGTAAGGDLLSDILGMGSAGVGALLPTVLGAVAVLLVLYAASTTALVGRLGLKTTFVYLLILSVTWGILGLFSGIPLGLLVVPGLLASLLIVLGFRRLHVRARSDGNLQLLVLRVFGADRSTAFLFGSLVRAWRHVGSFITVVDPSYIRYQFSLSSAETRLGVMRVIWWYGVLMSVTALLITGVATVASLGGSALAMTWQSIPWDMRLDLLGTAGWLLILPMAILPVVWAVKRRFQESSEDLDGRVHQALHQPMKWDATFPGYPMYCFDDVWRRAVRSLLDVSDVVLMDLRGLTPARAGIAYEIGLVLDRYPLSRSVFLVDPATRDDVVDMLRTGVASVSAESPNSGVAHLTAQLYLAGEDERDDIPRIVSVLAAAAASDPGRPPLAAVAAPERRRVLRWLGTPFRRLGRHWRRTLLTVDSWAGTPRFGVIAAPVAFVALLILLGFRVPPVLRAYEAYRPTTVDLPDDPVREAEAVGLSGEAVATESEGTPSPGIEALAVVDVGFGPMRFVSGGPQVGVETAPGDLVIVGEGDGWADLDVWVGSSSGRVDAFVAAFQEGGLQGREYTFGPVGPEATLYLEGPSGVTAEVADPASLAVAFDGAGSPARASAWAFIEEGRTVQSSSGEALAGRLVGTLLIQGGVAAGAQSFGRVRITTAEGPDGEALRVQAYRFPVFDLSEEFRDVEGGVWMEFQTRSVEPLTGIARLTGTVTLRVPSSVVTVADIGPTLRSAGTSIDEWGQEAAVVRLSHPSIDEFGSVSVKAYAWKAEDVSVELHGPVGHAATAVLVRADGSVTRPHSWMSSDSGDGTSLIQSFSREDLEGASLRLLLRSEEEVVAFDLRNIPVEAR